MKQESQNQIARATPADKGEIHHATVRRAIAARPATGLSSAKAGGQAKRPGNVNPVAFVYHALRGRIVLAAVLGMLIGGAGAAAGWKMGRPIYHSEGLLRVAYSMPRVFDQTDQNEPMGQMFDPYMQSQKLLIRSRRVIDLAVQDPIWQQAGVQAPDNPDEYYTDNLDVVIQPRSELIQLSVSDSQPATAACAVTAIANAYKQLYLSQEQERERHRSTALEEREAFLKGRLAGLHAQEQAVAKKYGTTALDTLHDATMLRVNRFDTALADIRMAMLNARPAGQAPTNSAARTSDGGRTGPPAAPGEAVAAAAAAAAVPNVAATTTTSAAEAATEAAGPTQLTPEQLALTDTVMRGYLDDQEALEQELIRLAAQRYGQSHPQVISTQRALDEARARVRRYAALPRPAGVAPGRPVPDAHSLAISTEGKTVEQLRQDEAVIRGFLDEAKAELAAIGIDRLGLRQIEAEKASSQLEFEQVTRRVAALKGEAMLGGRLTILSVGEVPVSPDRDPRRKMAAAGLLAGGCMPAALLVLLPLLRPRYRYHDEAESDMAAKVPLLGILPALNNVSPHAPETAQAAHSVHQLRVTLQSQRVREGCNSYLVTSATAGEGKTSLTMSLGLSFAASHMRTLVIDGDIISRALTRGLKAGKLDGLHEALAAGDMHGHVRKTAGGVYVLSAGQVASADACGLSPAAVNTLLEQARRHFDVVLIDSGPVMGSVEAAVFAPQVDGVIFAIARGQRPALVQRAQQRLDALGARMAGVVFNRAALKDFNDSPFGSSYASTSSPDPERAGSVKTALATSRSSSSSAATMSPSVATATAAAAPESAASRFTRFGPLVQAVAAGIPIDQN